MGRGVSIGVLCILAAVCLEGCSEATDDQVYVPAPGFKLDLKIAAAKAGRVGVPILLHAERASGPWMKVARQDVPDGVSMLTSEPPLVEKQVALNVRWIVTPEGLAEFNVPKTGLPNAPRTVTFSAPGEYVLRAITAFPVRGESNEIKIVIHP